MSAIDYKQYNYSASYCGGSFASQGCGPTSVADIVEVSPLTVAQWMTNNGYATTDGHGTYWGGISAGLTAFGAGGRMLNGNSLLGLHNSPYFDQWQSTIRSGCMGVLLMGAGTNSYWTSSGHYIAVVQYDSKTDKYLVYDPASTTRTGWHPFSDFAGNIKILYTSTKKWGEITPPVVTTYSFKVREIRIGDSGKDVLLLQRLLKSRGLYKGLDSHYGPKVEKAVKAYQQWINDHGGKLKVDGVCGPATWTSILGIAGDTKTVHEIKLGDKGIDVYILQELLSSVDLYHGALDKEFGLATRTALKDYQRKKGIAIDGVCGPTTWKKLIKL